MQKIQLSRETARRVERLVHAVGKIGNELERLNDNLEAVYGLDDQEGQGDE